MEKEIRNLLLFAPEHEFVAPYIERALGSGWSLSVVTADDIAGDSGEPDAAVMLSSTEIYKVDAAGAEDIDESAPILTDSSFAKAEDAFDAFCRKHGLRAIVLRCANTVGTGMTGFMRSLAEWVYRGWLFHFPGNQARISTVHAADVAQCVATLVGAGIDATSDPLILNVTDGVNPTIHDLCEAFAYRFDQKRISTLSTRPQQWIAAAIYGSRRMRRLTTTLTFDGSALRSLTGTKPLSVTEYLQTHVYDENSL